MAVEKGQKYKGGNGAPYEIVSDPFEYEGRQYVGYVGPSETPMISTAETFLEDHFTLIREPKFKVGDRATYYGAEHEVVAVSEKTDQEGDFGYLVLDSDGYFNLFDDSCGLKAAE